MKKPVNPFNTRSDFGTVWTQACGANKRRFLCVLSVIDPIESIMAEMESARHCTNNAF